MISNWKGNSEKKKAEETSIVIGGDLIDARIFSVLPPLIFPQVLDKLWNLIRTWADKQEWTFYLLLFFSVEFNL